MSRHGTGSARTSEMNLSGDGEGEGEGEDGGVSRTTFLCMYH